MTGYTCEMVEKSQDFKAFALSCARAFGALITMREDPMDAPVPDTIEPDPYHRDEIEAAKADVARLKAMTEEERREFGESKRAKDVAMYRATMAENEATNAKLRAMLAQVKAWTPPTPDHVGVKEFMTEQLTSSMKDTGESSYYAKAIREAERRSVTDWHASALESAEESVEYHRKKWAEEVRRAAERTVWVRALKDSLSKG